MHGGQGVDERRIIEEGPEGGPIERTCERLKAGEGETGEAAHDRLGKTYLEHLQEFP
jgi:hypothetical protein